MFSKFKVLTAATVISLSFTTMGIGAYALGKPERMGIVFDGIKKDLSIEYRSDRTMASVEELCKALGASGTFGEAEGRITIKKDNNILDMQIDRTDVCLSGHRIYSDAAPFIKDNTVYVPLRLIAENLGFNVDYVRESGSINITAQKLNSISFATKMEKKDGDVEIDMQYPQISGLNNAKVQDKINGIFKKHIEGFKGETKDFESEVQELRKIGFKHNYQAISNYSIMYNKNGILSVVFSDYTYTGGAHGGQTNTSYTFDLRTGELLDLKDLFQAGTDYKPAINEIVKEEFKKIGCELTKFESINCDQAYYLNNKGIVVFFQQYEYTPYAFGIPEFTIPYEKVIDLLQFDYLNKNIDIDLNSKNANSILVDSHNNYRQGKGYLVDIRYPSFDGFENHDIQAAVNKRVKDYADNFIKAIDKEYSDVFDGSDTDDISNYAFSLDYKIEYNKNNIVSIVFYEMKYTGGAHAMSWQKSFTFSIEDGKAFKLSDIFKERVNYIDRLDKGIKEKIENDPLKEFINFESIGKIDNQPDYFYISEDGSIVVYFQHCEIGPYCLGMPEFKFSREELRNLLNEVLLKNTRN